MLLAAGLLVGALAAGLVGVAVEDNFKAETWGWLFRTSFRAWLFGSAYLGLFSGISLISRSSLKARALALFVWIAFGIAHSIFTSDVLNQKVPGLHYLGWIFPAEHREALWSPDWGVYLPAVGALVLFGALGFASGHAIFRRRDA